jgi:hypothetical protein
VLITKEVEVKWTPSNKKYYSNLGYKYSKFGDSFVVKVEDLSKGSSVLVEVQCDACGKIFSREYNLYLLYGHKDGKYYCQQCVNAGYKKWITFYDWCYENLSKEEADKLIARWDYEKNVDKNGKVLSLKDVSHASSGLNGKGYWFKCLDHPEHKSEQKRTSSLTNGKQNTIDCHQCNSLGNNYPYLIKYLVNKEDAYNYAKWSSKEIPMKCPNCGYEKEWSNNRLLYQGFCCPRCSDGVSYPQKILFSVLDQLNYDFKTELTKTSLEWCGDYRYDFYLENLSCIVETHGIQHYVWNNRYWDSLEDVQNNDNKKELLAKENGIKNYITIDCRESNIEWIKNNIMCSELPILLSFKESDVDWLKCHEYGCNSLVKTVCDLWNNGVKNAPQIAEVLKINRSTVNRYLKKGAVLGWCDYDPKEEHEKNLQLIHKNKSKQVICLNTGEIFESTRAVSNKYKDIDKRRISDCCTGKKKSVGKHPITGEPLQWMYYEEYIKNKI